MFDWENFVNLAENMAIVILFILVGNRLNLAWTHPNRHLRRAIIGLLFGMAGILSMLLPFPGGYGSLAPMYPIVAALSAWVGGPLSGLVTAGSLIGFRLGLGGVGIEAGIASIAAAASIGALYRVLKPADGKHAMPIVHPLLIGLCVAASSSALSFLLPEAMRAAWLSRSAPSVFLIFPLSFLLFHFFMTAERPGKRRSAIDETTGLMHSGLFMKQLRKRIQARQPFDLAILDLSGYKKTNAMNGESARAELLRQVGQRLASWLPERGSVCRLEGEDFLVCLAGGGPAANAEASPDTWNELSKHLSTPYWVNGRQYFLSIPIGTTAYSGDIASAEQLLPRAYAALQHAKDSAGLRSVQYHEKLTERIRQRSLIEAHIDNALPNGQLSLRYQPQYEIATGRLRGFEALLRWEHPELGAVEPDSFLPVAERTHAIVPIGEWAIREACRTLNQVAPVPSELTMSVNLSREQLLEPGFPEAVNAILSDTGVAPNRLEFELKESELSASIEAAEKPIKKLRALGVRLALDDFGFGSSSISCIRKLPIQLVKIDNGRMPDIESLSDREVNGSLIRLVKRLDYGIVAKRLETYEQLAFLKAYQCDYAQGNLLGHPLTNDQLPSVIQPSF
ncbi:EAL domain-containing protein [Paenibacillaceae bacterium WGS1546]|uniref:EAL domain-containing protein n=1 Tax=Cohnella sp. WGS1546 TaxID=3366810 RepID=UPI00372D6958